METRTTVEFMKGKDLRLAASNNWLTLGLYSLARQKLHNSLKVRFHYSGTYHSHLLSVNKRFPDSTRSM